MVEDDSARRRRRAEGILPSEFWLILSPLLAHICAYDGMTGANVQEQRLL